MSAKDQPAKTSEELHQRVSREVAVAMGALDLSPGAPAVDLTLGRPPGDGDLLATVFRGTALTKRPRVDAEGRAFGGLPGRGIWLRFDASGSIRWVDADGSEATVTPYEPAVEMVAFGAVMRAELRLTLPGERQMLLACALGKNDADALARLRSLTTHLHQDVLPDALRPKGADVIPATEQPLADQPRAKEATAAQMALWLGHWEEDAWVIRDQVSVGPRQATSRDLTVALVLAVGTLSSGWRTAVSFRAGDVGQAGLLGVVTVVLAVAIYAAIRIAQHSAAYRANGEALFFVRPGIFVVSPWLSRQGAVDLNAEGRFGAAYPIEEFHESLASDRAGSALVQILSVGGMIDVGAVQQDHGAAEFWAAAINSVAQDVKKYTGKPIKKAKAKPALAALSVASFTLACLVLVSLTGATASCGSSTPDSSLAAVATSSQPVEPPTRSATASSSTVPATPSPSPSGSSIEPASSVPNTAPTASPKGVRVFDGDLPAARKLARNDKRLLFVEVWAPWCHTCLSMKHFVLPDPSLKPFESSIVFAAIDSDRPESAGFLERHAVSVWPTLFVVDPSTDKVLSHWQGAASLRELKTMLQDAIDSKKASGNPNGPVAALRRAKSFHGGGKYGPALARYKQALKLGGDDWERRSEALYGILFCQSRLSQRAACTATAEKHLAEIEGAAIPTDFSWTALACAKRAGKADAEKIRQLVIERMKRHTTSPPPDASVDDRSDALSLYASLLPPKPARAVTLRQAKLLREAQAMAPTPKAASTYDYALLQAYLNLGKGRSAVEMLTRRRKQLPNSYDTAARLSSVLSAMGRWHEALAHNQDAVRLSYGPRKLRYLNSQAFICRKLKDGAGAVAALDALLATYEALPAAQKRQPRYRQMAAAAKKQRSGLVDGVTTEP